MRRLYEQWQSSGLGKAAFCRQHGIGKSTFHYWAKKLGEEGVQPSRRRAGNMGFSQIPVRPVMAAQDRQALAVISFPSGMRVELYSPVEASFLKDLMQ